MVLLVVLLMAALVLAAAFVSAHEAREVGDYAVTFGWRVEPAYAGLYNGPEFWSRITTMRRRSKGWRTRCN
ncbi:MAG: hypothetical protein U0703_28225 [Anaerolineae bacterium]